MATVTDPSFGAGFDAVAFRDAIHNTMLMGAPSNVPDRATFTWANVDDYSVHDPSGNPYDWTETPTHEVVKANVQIPVAVQFSPTSETGTPLGQIDESKVTLTILDVDYAQITGSTTFLLGQRTYRVKFVAPPQGLFSVTVYSVYGEALDG